MDANQIEDWLADSQLPERAELDLIIPLPLELAPQPPTIESENTQESVWVSNHWKTSEY